jgi:hypothetical protein
MIPDAALRSIADNLAALRVDPITYLRVAVAVVGSLIVGETEPAQNIPEKFLRPPGAPRPPGHKSYGGVRLAGG